MLFKIMLTHYNLIIMQRRRMFIGNQLYTPYLHPNSKYNVVKNAMLETYAFLNKLRQDYGNDHAELIIVPFNNCTEIYSTIKFTDAEHYVPFEQMKQIIEEKLTPDGNTDFTAINNTNVKLDEYLAPYNDKIQVIKYIMSDGCHNNKSTRASLFELSAHTYDYSLGIGKDGKKFDEELLRHMGKTFVNGNDGSLIEESIIGDTFNYTNMVATNLQISIITDAVNIGCSHDIIKKEPFVNIIEFDETSDFNVDATIDSTNQCTAIKLTRITNVDKKIIFIFYVDVSGSMGELINFTSNDEKSSVNIETSTDEIDIESIIEIDPNKFNKEKNTMCYKYTLEIIPKFNIATELFAIMSSVNQIAIELSYTDSNNNQITKYIKPTFNNKINKIDLDLMSKCCHLRDKLRELLNASDKDRISIAKNLNELVRCPKYNRIISDQTNLSPVKASLFSIVENIKKITFGQSVNNTMNTISDRINRTINCTQSRAYSTRLSSPSTITNIDNMLLCTICKYMQREVIYNCGHCILCKNCDEQNKKCPICIGLTQNVRLLMLHDVNNSVRCNEEGCDNVASYVSNDCGHLTYCRCCITNNKICPCGAKITKIKRIYF